MSLRFCFECGCKVDVETELDYPWHCPNCDENLYNIETDTVDELDFEKVLYGLYLHNWIANHDEGEPVCFDEFMDCEFHEEKIVENLLSRYGLHHKIAEYREIMESE